MRIIGGRLRGKRLEAPEDAAIRPTSDRARESIFNVLAHRPDAGDAVAGAVVLDAFCGTGAMGLEALSRGAAFCTFLDATLAALKLAERNAKACGEAPRARFLLADATRPLRPERAATLAFLDPPWGADLAAPALSALAAAGWRAPGALCVVETDARERFAPPAGFEQVDRRSWGRARPGRVFTHLHEARGKGRGAQGGWPQACVCQPS